jgi:hypothetical protein
MQITLGRRICMGTCLKTINFMGAKIMFYVYGIRMVFL